MDQWVSHLFTEIEQLGRSSIECPNCEVATATPSRIGCPQPVITRKVNCRTRIDASDEDIAEVDGDDNHSLSPSPAKSKKPTKTPKQAKAPRWNTQFESVRLILPSVDK